MRSLRLRTTIAVVGALCVLVPAAFSGPGAAATPLRAELAPLRAGDALLAPQLEYYGGRVLSHVEIDLVVWGRWTYGSTVPLTGARSVTSFFGGIAKSKYLDWLREYDTPTQTIGRGVFDAGFTIHPSATNDGAVITDTQIKAELAAQIHAGRLPRPNANRLYVLFFRSGQVIATPHGDSQHGFCAYHGTMPYPSHSVAYAVVPYELDNRGCRVASRYFDRVTTIASHELIEAITDPGVGIKRVAWYDRANGEIGDICAHTSVPGSVLGGDGVRYLVQREWSNQAGACVLVR
jgi:hypothetical protein